MLSIQLFIGLGNYLVSIKNGFLVALMLLLAACQSTHQGQGPTTVSRTEIPARGVPSSDNVLEQLLKDALQYQRKSKWQEAIEIAERGLRIDRTFADFYAVLSISYRNLGDAAQAQVFLSLARRYCRDQCSRFD